MAEKTKVIVIAGPTASSKSEIAFNLASEFNGEIINADSIQVFKHFDIGSAKPLLTMRSLIPHHLIDILNPDEDFNAFKFKELARNAVKDITAREKIPVVVGGTGLYIRTFLYDLFVQDEKKIRIERERLNVLCDKEGLEFLYKKLTEIDPISAIKIHPNDKIRIIRALEFYYSTGTPLSKIHENYNFTDSSYDFKIFVPCFPKEEMLLRIEKRTKTIFELGIVDEVKKIIELGYKKDIKPLKSIGYKEALKVLDGLMTLNEAVVETIKNTKAYAKRQRVWFKKEKNTRFIAVSGSNFKNFYEEVKLFLHKN